jgi:hypothetical protein
MGSEDVSRQSGVSMQAPGPAGPNWPKEYYSRTTKTMSSFGGSALCMLKAMAAQGGWAHALAYGLLPLLRAGGACWEAWPMQH